MLFTYDATAYLQLYVRTTSHNLSQPSNRPSIHPPIVTEHQQNIIVHFPVIFSF